MIKFKNKLLTLTLTAFVLGSSAVMAANIPAPKEETTKGVGNQSNACSACIATFLASYSLFDKTCAQGFGHTAMPNPSGPKEEKFAKCVGYYCTNQVDCWADELTTAITTLTTCSNTCTQ